MVTFITLYYNNGEFQTTEGIAGLFGLMEFDEILDQETFIIIVALTDLYLKNEQ